MSLSKVSAGDGFRYLYDQTVSADRQRNGQSMQGYYTASGCPDGVWIGSGAEALGVSGTVSENQMTSLFGMGMHPDADRIIGQVIEAGGSAERAMEQASLGRCFYQFEPSNERLAGAFRYELRKARAAIGDELTVMDRIAAGQRAARRYLMDQGHDAAADTRLGGRQPVAGFDHTFSVPKSFSVMWAAADAPTRKLIESWHEAAISEALRYIETHSLFTRKGPDGVATVDVTGLVGARFRHWDSRSGDPQLHDHVVIANRVCDADGHWRTIDAALLYRWKVAASEVYNRALTDQVHAAGWATRVRSLGAHKQPVVELAGVTDAQIDAFSTRRGAITARTKVLELQYAQAHGHAPDRAASYALAQQATLETRTPKAGPHRLDELQASWRDRMVEQPHLVPLTATPATVNVDTIARQIVDVVSHDHATWGRHHVEAAVNRWATQQAAGVPETVRNNVIETALGTHSIAITPAARIPDLPAAIRASDGLSVYVKPHHTLYTSAAILAAEDRIVAASRDLVLGAITPDAISEALAAAPEWMDEDGRAFARELASTDRLLSVGIGPAGTGKTTAAAVISDAAHRAGVHVHALATAARTATDLGRSIHADTTRTLAAWTANPAATGLGRGDLIIIDEAGMAATGDLDRVIADARQAGAQVIALGDDRQLGPVAAGGAMSLVTAATGAARLTVAHRFDYADEAIASLKLRDGDATWYINQGRVHGASRQTLIHRIVTQWATDRFTDVHDCLMIADTHADVADLNQAAQTWLLDHGFLTDRTHTTTLADDTTIGPGDLIVTRRNAPTLIASDRKTTVKNRMRWQVIAVTVDGAVQAQDTHGHLITLPASYVQHHVELGYAVTNHGAQGSTVDTAHYLTSGRADRSAAYPAMTRGRINNQVWVADTHNDQEAATVLAAMVARAPQAASAHHIIAHQLDATANTGDLIRATRDLANGYDALRYTIACARAGIRLHGLAHTGAVYNQLRAGERAGLSTTTLARLAATDLADQPHPDALLIAATMAGHIQAARAAGTNPDMAALSNHDLAVMITSLRAHHDALTLALAGATNGPGDPHPVTLTDGTIRPSWAERLHGDLDETALATHRADLDRTREGLADLHTQTLARRDAALTAFHTLNQPGQRLTPATQAAAHTLTDLDQELAALTQQRTTLTARLAELDSEIQLRANMAPHDRLQEEAQRLANTSRGRAAILDARARHLRGDETDRITIHQLATRLHTLETEQTARAHQPDLALADRPRWDHYLPIANDPHLPDQHRDTLRTWQTTIDTRLAEAGAWIANQTTPPAWTRELGPLPPAHTPQRDTWHTLAGRIATYRQLLNWTDPDHALPPASRADTALPTDPAVDLHTLRALMSTQRHQPAPTPPPANHTDTYDEMAAIAALPIPTGPGHVTLTTPETTPTLNPPRPPTPTNTPHRGHHQ
ncbi:MobF family relaxase [Acidipropionibacterium timonense]|uniref:MobF family relaxase n=1 Tax=Acidipropionibacterium timonense TaxID=2161818 RepID=UPI002477DE70|nr:MobF family relaxase [Acidipropionibacterium timonense]